MAVLEYGIMEPTYTAARTDMALLEKRQLFLRSYHFSRKQSVGERIKKSVFRVRKAVWVRFRSARKLRKMIWFRLRKGLFFSSRRRKLFLRLHNYSYSCTAASQSSYFG